MHFFLNVVGLKQKENMSEFMDRVAFPLCLFTFVMFAVINLEPYSQANPAKICKVARQVVEKTGQYYCTLRGL